MKETRVRDVMTSSVVTIPPDTTVPAAMAMMRHHGIRHLPVVEHGRLVGMVSRGDLREASSGAAFVNADTYELHFMLSRLTVSKLMARKVITITADAFIVRAAELMTEHKIAGLPVVDADGAVIGIITESDLLKLLVRRLSETENQPVTAEGA